jgi:hypothetical protein
MVPQRSIPFRVVALLGLNDGDYPRPRSDGGLDLMLARPRIGDRDARAEDRYLFLEAIMSARDALHLSWIGQGVTDGKPRNPAQPLAELMGFLDQTHDSMAIPTSRPGPGWSAIRCSPSMRATSIPRKPIRASSPTPPSSPASLRTARRPAGTSWRAHPRWRRRPPTAASIRRN